MINDDEQLRAYVVEYLHKRRRLLTLASSSLEERSRVHSFLDELLVEILVRLSCSKFAVLCKCVCKHWAALISNPDFIRQFVVFKLEKKWMGIKASGNPDLNVLERQERSFAIVVQKAHKVTCEGWLLQLKDPVSNLRNFCVSPLALPYLVEEKQASVSISIMAACSDLLLCCRDMSSRFEYLIYNVQTKQSLLLPTPPFYFKMHYQCVVSGFICDPFYTCEGGISNCNVTLNAYRYCAIVVHGTLNAASKYNAHLISSSDSSQWTVVKVSLPRRCKLMGSWTSFSFAGMLHFRCSNGLIGFDPYSGGNDPGRVIDCHYIRWPPNLRGIFCTVVHQGHLQTSNIDEDRVYTSWVLEDYKRGEWSLHQRIEIHEWVPRDRFAAKGRNSILWPGFLIGIHPFNPDIIYFLSSLRIMLCDASKRTVEATTCMSAKSIGVYPALRKFSMLLPIWPTPLPTLV